MVIRIYTSGICDGLKAPKGTWGVVLEYMENKKVISGTVEDVTKNKIDLVAVLEALKSLKASGKSKQIAIYTTNEYVAKGFNVDVITWKNNNWQTSKKKDIKNPKEWFFIDKYKQEFPLAKVYIESMEKDQMQEAFGAALMEDRKNAV